MEAKINVEFETAKELTNLVSGELLNDSLGKIDRAITEVRELETELESISGSSNAIYSPKLSPVSIYGEMYDALISSDGTLYPNLTDYYYNSSNSGKGFVANHSSIGNIGGDWNFRLCRWISGTSSQVNGKTETLYSGPISVLKNLASAGYKRLFIAVNRSSQYGGGYGNYVGGSDGKICLSRSKSASDSDVLVTLAEYNFNSGSSISFEIDIRDITDDVYFVFVNTYNASVNATAASNGDVIKINGVGVGANKYISSFGLVTISQLLVI